jgi:hypothetical protein
MLKKVKTLLSIVIVILFSIQAKGQDSLYARDVDSSWIKLPNRHALLKKREKIGKIRFDYSFYKSTGKLRSIVVWDMPEKPHLFIFYYLNDSIVMISPVGQQPYYILSNNLVYSKERRHSLEKIQSLIAMANEYLLQAYKKLNKHQKFVSTGV